MFIHKTMLIFLAAARFTATSLFAVFLYGFKGSFQEPLLNERSPKGYTIPKLTQNAFD